MQGAKKTIFSFAIATILGLAIWFLPAPDGVSVKAIHLLAIFVFTIVGIITKPLPMGAVAVIGMTLVTLTKTLTFAEAFSGFNNRVVWLIVCAFFIARGFIKSGLGERIAYALMGVLGKSTLGMGYGLIITDFFLAPAIPSMTARVGGVIYPVLTSLSKAFGSEPHSHPRKMGAYLTQVAFQGSLITSAMFLTSMAGNPLIADIAKDIGIEITWGGWALAAIVPGLLSIILIPLILYKIYPPEVKETPDAKSFAKKQLKSLGKMKRDEWIMVFSFVLLITLWIMGPHIGMIATNAALIGLSILLITNVISWNDVLEEKGAWNILFWFATLVMMASFLNRLGLTIWFSNWVVQYVQGFNWYLAFGVLSLIYFYSHYFFASNTAHIGSMFPPFLILAVSVGTPPMVAALTLGFMSSLFGGLTHYGCGPAPILFGAGYVKVSKWWDLGFKISILNLIIWLIIGGVWWKCIGLF